MSQPPTTKSDLPQAAIRRSQHPLLSVVLAQFLGALVASGLVLVLMPILAAGFRFNLLSFALLQGSSAVVAAWGMRAPVWWLPIHLGFLPLAVLARGMGLPSWLWASGFLLLLLVFWRTDTSQVPLYLSNRKTRKALALLLPATPCRVIDLGCGDGALLRHLAGARPDCHFVGIEHAPLTWAWAWLAARGHGNLRIHRGDFWNHSLSPYDLAYAFLSPVPMARIWAKACAEMAPGARFVSNSFVVPEQAAQSVVEVGDSRRTRLYIYVPQCSGKSALANGASPGAETQD